MDNKILSHKTGRFASKIQNPLLTKQGVLRKRNRLLHTKFSKRRP